MKLDFGGPGPGCSAARVRRLLAGELQGAEKDRTQAHIDSCHRCAATQQEILQEKAALARDVPFPLFAAGVAEKLARQPRRPLLARWASAGMAAAAAIALVGGAVLVLRPADTETVRTKGAPAVQVFVHDQAGVHELDPAQPLAPGAQLMIALRPAGHSHAAAVLLEPAEASVVYAGIAVNGTVPQAFEWTGKGAATLLVIFSDRQLDAKTIRSARDVPQGAQVVQVKLHR